MQDFAYYIKKAGDFHGHPCAGIVLGVKISLAAMKALGLDPDTKNKNLIVYTEIDRCMTDAVQVVTGCTLGHRSLKFADYGKFAATFIDTNTGRAVRATVLKHISNEPTYEETLQKIAQIPDEELVTLQEVDLQIPEADLPGPPKTRVTCAACGERVVDGRHIVRDGKTFCRACAGDGYYRKIKDVRS